MERPGGLEGVHNTQELKKGVEHSSDEIGRENVNDLRELISQKDNKEIEKNREILSNIVENDNLGNSGEEVRENTIIKDNSSEQKSFFNNFMTIGKNFLNPDIESFNKNALGGIAIMAAGSVMSANPVFLVGGGIAAVELISMKMNTKNYGDFLRANKSVSSRDLLFENTPQVIKGKSKVLELHLDRNPGKMKEALAKNNREGVLFIYKSALSDILTLVSDLEESDRYKDVSHIIAKSDIVSRLKKIGFKDCKSELRESLATKVLEGFGKKMLSIRAGKNSFAVSKEKSMVGISREQLIGNKEEIVAEINRLDKLMSH